MNYFMKLKLGNRSNFSLLLGVSVFICVIFTASCSVLNTNENGVDPYKVAADFLSEGLIVDKSFFQQIRSQPPSKPLDREVVTLMKNVNDLDAVRHGAENGARLFQAHLGMRFAVYLDDCEQAILLSERYAKRNNALAARNLAHLLGEDMCPQYVDHARARHWRKHYLDLQQMERNGVPGIVYSPTEELF